MSAGRGRPAALPPAGWQPPPVQRGLMIEFRSDDGRQQRNYDFARLHEQGMIREELAAAFGEAVGPLGRWRRMGSADGLWTAARKITRWLADNRPSMHRIGQLSVADTRMMLNSMRTPNGDVPVTAHVRALFQHCPEISDDVMREIIRTSRFKNYSAKQPYTEQEWRWISTALRGNIRRARTRIYRHRALLAEFRGGHLDHLHPDHPQRCLGEVMDHLSHTGRLPTTPGGTLTKAARIAGHETGRPVKTLIHLTTGEAWAFAALLTGLTGVNASTVAALPAPEFRSTNADEPGVVIVNAVKYRRGPRAAMSVPLAALPNQLHPPGSDRRPQRVLDTSLTTAYGTFMLLLDLTEPARQLIGSRRAFVYHNRRSALDLAEGDGLARGSSPEQRRRWMAAAITGEAERDELIMNLDLRRLRMTHLERHRRPIAHTPATLTRYLSNMHAVTEESFQVVREALDQQVEDALSRRQMTVEVLDSTAPATVHDTVLAACVDYEHSPLDGGIGCRRTFLTCLDCANARAFPRHLPFQLAVLEGLTELRATMSIQQWTVEFAGRVAQLESILTEFEPAQREQARTQITDHHRRLAARLLTGDLDPL